MNMGLPLSPACLPAATTGPTAPTATPLVRPAAAACPFWLPCFVRRAAQPLTIARPRLPPSPPEPAEKARRRDPKLHSYSGIACPSMKKVGVGSSAEPPPPPG